MRASFEEKSVWVQLISMVVVLAGYLVVAGLMLANGVRVVLPFFLVFMVGAVVMVVLLVGGHILAAVTGPVERADERDRLIGWRAESHASWVLGAGAFLAIAALAAGYGAVWVVNLLIVSMFLSEVLKYALQLTFYRRGVRS